MQAQAVVAEDEGDEPATAIEEPPSSLSSCTNNLSFLTLDTWRKSEKAVSSLQSFVAIKLEIWPC